MPGSVSLAAPNTVLPQSLCRAYSLSRSHAAVLVRYKGGETEVGMLSATSRRVWKQTKRLTPAEMNVLRNFYLARRGATEPFYFYDLVDARTAAYDLTGTLLGGRRTVRFDGTWQESWSGPGRGEVSIRLVELS